MWREKKNNPDQGASFHFSACHATMPSNQLHRSSTLLHPLFVVLCWLAFLCTMLKTCLQADEKALKARWHMTIVPLACGTFSCMALPFYWVRTKACTDTSFHYGKTILTLEEVAPYMGSSVCMCKCLCVLANSGGG